MNSIRFRLRRAAVIAVAVVAGGVVGVALPGQAFAAKATVTRGNVPLFPNLVRFFITNDSSTTLNSWRVDFDLPAGTTPGFWDGPIAVTTAAGHTTVASTIGSSPLGPGGNFNFGIIMSGPGFPLHCFVNLTTPCIGTKN